MSEPKQRYPVVDLLRGIAIILMIFFHFFYDLTIFRYTNINFIKDPFWFGLPRLIVFLFMFCVGISLCLVHLREIRWKRFNKRLLQLVIFAAIISIYTYFFFPRNWVYFGTLHSIALCSLMALPFIRLPVPSLLIAIILLSLSIIFKVDIPWIKLPHPSMDYIPPFPWIGVVLLGIFAFHQNLHKIPLKFEKYLSPVTFLGRHSLLIYIIHQPILYGAVYLFSVAAKSLKF